MYIIKEIGIGKKVCNADGVTFLYPTLSQKKLKKLFTLNCEFIEYVEQQKGTKTETSESSTDSKYPKGGKQTEDKKNNSFSSTRRKQNSRKGAKKS